MAENEEVRPEPRELREPKEVREEREQRRNVRAPVRVEDDEVPVSRPVAEARTEMGNPGRRVESAQKRLASGAQKAGIDLGDMQRRLANNPASIYQLDVPEEEVFDPADVSNVNEGARLLADQERIADRAFVGTDLVDPLIRARDAVQRMEESRHYEGIARTLQGAVLENEEGTPAIDVDNLPSDVILRHGGAAEARRALGRPDKD